MTDPAAPASRLTKAEINAFPLRRYEGPIEIVDAGPEAEAAAGRLAGEEVLGFDTESRPSFRKGENHPPALLQLAGAETVVLFRLDGGRLPPAAADLLARERPVKAGVATGRDVRELVAVEPFRPLGFVDLSPVAERAGVRNLGLRGLAAALLHCRISKGARLTDWSRRPLTPAQLRYAATDAWISRELYLRMQALGWV